MGKNGTSRKRSINKTIPVENTAGIGSESEESEVSFSDYFNFDLLQHFLR